MFRSFVYEIWLGQHYQYPASSWIYIVGKSNNLLRSNIGIRRNDRTGYGYGDVLERSKAANSQNDTTLIIHICLDHTFNQGNIICSC